MRVEFGELDSVLRTLLAAQRYAVLGTQGTERLTLNLMAFAVTDDLRFLILATARDTAKYTNLLCSPQVSLLVDNRSNRTSDTETALALTVDGLAEQVSGVQREQLVGAFLTRHPQLRSFVDLPDGAVFRVRVERYELVSGLYDVREAVLS